MAEAATYYVATTGSDTNPGTLALPFRTIQKAANTTVPGDTVKLRAGIYNEIVMITTGGTAGNPITYQAFSGETPTLDGTGLGAVIAAININDVPNIIIDGLTVQNYFGNSQSPVALIRVAGIGVGGGITPIPNNSTTIIRNNTLHGMSNGAGIAQGLDNPAGVAIAGYAGTVEVSNNVIHDNSGSAFVGNNTCIVIFNDQLGSAISNIKINNNHCYNEGVGIKWKHHPDSGTAVTLVIEKNIVHDIYERSGIEVNGTKGAIIRNNIIYNVNNSNASARAITIGVDNPTETLNTHVYNNSTYNVAAGLMVSAGSTGADIHDNIFYGTNPIANDVAGIWLNQTIGFAQVDFDLFAGVFQTRVALWSQDVYEALSQVQARGFETHGLATSNPLYVNPTTDFHLQVTSPAKGVGTDGRDMGAYPKGDEIIGPTDRPLRPTTLRVQ